MAGKDWLVQHGFKIFIVPFFKGIEVALLQEVLILGGDMQFAQQSFYFIFVQAIADMQVGIKIDGH